MSYHPASVIEGWGLEGDESPLPTQKGAFLDWGIESRCLWIEKRLYLSKVDVSGHWEGARQPYLVEDFGFDEVSQEEGVGDGFEIEILVRYG